MNFDLPGAPQTKKQGRRREQRGSGGDGGGVKESENRKHGKERKQCTLVPGSFFSQISLPLSTSFSLSLAISFLSVSLEACQLEPWLPPRELEDRGCVWSSGRGGKRQKENEMKRKREREREEESRVG